MDKALARDLLEAFRNGTVPRYGLRELAVGVDEPLNALEEHLEYVSQGRTAVRFIEGAYGSGKSFLCALLREIALEKGFVTSLMVVSPDVPLGKLSVVYSRIMDGIRTAAKRTSTALPDILEKWLLAEYKRASVLAGGSKSDQHRQVLSQIELKLQGISDVAPGVASAVKAYYTASHNRNPELRRAAAAWLRGSSSVPLKVRKILGVRGEIGQEDLYGALKAVAMIIREAGYKGFLVVLDEVETVQRQAYQSQRNAAYEVLRVLVDSAGTNRFPGCLFVVTGTEQLFQDPLQGLRSYPALAERIERPENFTDQETSRQPILHLRGLDRSDLAAIAKKIRTIHATAYEWDAATSVTDNHLEDLARKVTDSFGESIERLPRGFLREVVHICDVAQEHGVRFDAVDQSEVDDRLADRLRADSGGRISSAESEQKWQTTQPRYFQGS